MVPHFDHGLESDFTIVIIIIFITSIVITFNSWSGGKDDSTALAAAKRCGAGRVGSSLGTPILFFCHQIAAN